MMYDLSFSPGNRIQNKPYSHRNLRNEQEAKTELSQNDKETTLGYASGISELAKNAKLRKASEDHEKQRIVSQLASIDASVRAHEMAHLAAAGAAATSGPRYVYVTGPDGKQYAVGGEVGISVSPVPGNLEATVQKARAIRAAALAPGNPSPQDLAVAAAATQMEMAALAALTKQRIERMQNASESQAGENAGFKLESNPSNTQLNDHSLGAYTLRYPEPLIDLYA